MSFSFRHTHPGKVKTKSIPEALDSYSPQRTTLRYLQEINTMNVDIFASVTLFLQI